MRKLLLLIALTLALQADIVFQPFAQAYHWDRDKDNNEKQEWLGLVYEHDTDFADGATFEVGASTMINSHYVRSNSFYVGLSKDIYKEGDWEVGLFADGGYRTGYDTNILLYGGAYAEWKQLQLKVAVNSSFIAFVVGYKFKGF